MLLDGDFLLRCAGEEGERNEKMAVPPKPRIQSPENQGQSEGPGAEKQPLAVPVCHLCVEA